MIIDLRSDTVTKPSQPMLESMFSAKVGDDVYDEDETVKELEQKTARIFGMEEGLFCPSGTMTNQLAIKILTQSGDEVICDKLAHIYNYEGGGIAFNSGASVRLLDGNLGRFNKDQVEENINPDNIHYPPTTLIALENTVNKGGGCFYTLPDIQEIYSIGEKYKIPLHLDGARIFNALVETGENPAEYGKYFSTISVCLSKGLGCPIGSVLLGNKELIKKAKRFRKVFGGGWRQAGYLAAAGIYALDHNIQRLKEDHNRAKIIGKNLQKLPFIGEILPVETNIVIFKMQNTQHTTGLINYLGSKNIKVSPFGKDYIRLVTHLDFTDEMLEKLTAVFQKTNVEDFI